MNFLSTLTLIIFCHSAQFGFIKGQSNSIGEEAKFEALSGGFYPEQQLLAPSQSSTKNKVGEKSGFICRKDDPTMNKVCRDFCRKAEAYDEGRCSPDASACLCKRKNGEIKRLKVHASSVRTKNGKNRKERGIMMESEIILPPHMQPFDHPFIPYGVCTPQTCLGACDPDCDTMCSPSLKCYCSCPEDLFYEYKDIYYDEEPSILATILG